MTKPIQTYESDEIVVTFDPNLCRHTGICLRVPKGDVPPTR